MDYSKLSAYDYDLPGEFIAQKPLEQRDKSRMMVLNRMDGSIEHKIFDQIPSYLEEGDLVVLNNTKVMPARLLGKIEGKTAAAELLLLYKLSTGQWAALAKPGKKLKKGARVVLAQGVEAVIEKVAGEGMRVVSFNATQPIEKLLPRLGKVPLPPYINTELDNPEKYQTIYALKEGSAAAPTAGLHFTDEILNTLRDKGVRIACITLHIGPGTFQPVKTEDIHKHIMHFEYYRIETTTARLLNMAKIEGKRVLAVGTTVTRVLETALDKKGIFKGRQEGWTGLYIYPGYQFRYVNCMLTNFHLPKSTLLMLVSALAGHDNIMNAYREAIENNYRFFSFGDCMLIK